MNEPPKRTESAEITIVCPSSPRVPLAPVSTVPGPTVEQIADVERARREAQNDIETLVACPGPCMTCACCHGEHMVSADRAVEWRRVPPEPEPA